MPYIITVHRKKSSVYYNAFLLLVITFLLVGCTKDPDCVGANCDDDPTPISTVAIMATFNGKIDPNNLPNYEDQAIPSYIQKDNGGSNPITNEGAILGRVLFYDKKLSIDNTLSCASCHQQEFAFSDTATVSIGVEGGKTSRHSMRLINARFASEHRFFWDERAATLEEQTTQPIQDHAELGFSGEQGRPGLSDLIKTLEETDYYQELFTLAFGDATVTESRMQRALAQFVRSIQSFDSKYDEGFSSDFSNFTESEKRGLELFTTVPAGSNGQRNGGGLDCFQCHRPPEFDIRPNSGNNGVITVAGNPDIIDLTNTRSPTLRDIANTQGELNGPMMHDGSITTWEELLEEVGNNEVDLRNDNLDPLIPIGGSLNITEQEAVDLIAFLKTLSGKDVYTNEKWADPF